MPEKPAVKSKKELKKYLGYWIEVGWLDAPAEKVILVSVDNYGLASVIEFKKGVPVVSDIDSFDQIRRIGPKAFTKW